MFVDPVDPGSFSTNGLEFSVQSPFLIVRTNIIVYGLIV